MPEIATEAELLAHLADPAPPPARTVDGRLVGATIRGLARTSDELPLLRALRIEGDVELEWLRTTRPVRFEGCTFDGGGTLVVEGAELAALDVDRCELGALRAHGLRTEGWVRVRDSKVGRSIELIDARIGGSCYIDGVTVASPEAPQPLNAVNLYRADIAGALYVSAGTEIYGRLRLIDATVQGVVTIVRCTIDNGRDRRAISADRLTANTVFIRGHETKLVGGLSLVGARIAVSLSLINLHVDAGKVAALRLAGADVGYRLHIDPSQIAGTVNLTGARTATFTYGRRSIEQVTRLNADRFAYEAVTFREPDDEGQFSGQPDLPPPDIDQLIDLVSSRRDGAYRPTTFDVLARALDRAGDPRAQKVRIAGARASVGASGDGALRTFRRRAAGWPFAFGHRPSRAAGILALTIAALATVARLARDVFVPTSSSDGRSGFNALGYAADVVLPIIDLGQESRWQIDASQPWAGVVEPLVWLAIVIGWVSSTAFLIAVQRYFRSSQGSG